MLGGQTQGHPARREHANPRRGREDRCDRLCLTAELLEVVEHEDERTVSEVLAHSRIELVVGPAYAQGARNGRQDRVGGRGRGQVDEARPVAQLRPEQLGDSERETSLAGSPRPGQRDEPSVGAKQRLHRGDLEPTSDERCGRHRQTRRLARFELRWRQRRVLTEDRPLEVLQRRPRIDAELVDEHGAGGSIGVECVLLPTRAVEREDLLLTEPFAVGLLRDQLFELGEQRVVLTQRQERAPADLERLQSQLLQVRRRAGRRRLVSEIRERRSSPERERSVHVFERSRRCALLECAVGPREELFELLGVELARVEVNAISGADRDDAIAAESTPEPVHVHLERAVGSARRPVVPECVDEPVARYDTAAFEEEHGEQRALLRAAERAGTVGRDGLNRPQQLELRRRPR